MYEIITKNLAAKLKINEKYITNVLNLLEEGNTIAFIARYRKELTNSLDEVAIKLIQDEFNYLKSLEERKEEVIQEKANLEQEVKELKEKQLGREELYAKLKEDSKIRWHREEYKKLLKRFDEYYNKLEQKIADKEQQIIELTKLLEVLN